MTVLDQVTSHAHTTPKVPVRRTVLRCYAFKDSSGQFAAECVDLDILVKAKTLDIARRKLKQAMQGYLETAVEMNEIKSLIPRKSPLYNRIRYHVFCAWYRLHQTSSLLFFKCPADGYLRACNA